MNLNFNLLTVSFIIGIIIFIVIIVLFSKQKVSQLSKNETNQDEWLYSNLLEKIYIALFNKKDPIVISKALGLEYDKYMINCNIANKAPNFKKECMMRIIGYFAFFLGVILSALLFNIIPLCIGGASFVLLVTRVTKTVEATVKAKRTRLQNDLSRFVDLFLSALEVGLPIETAIIETAESVPCVLSDELKASLAEMKIGAKSWSKALEEIAHKYEIDIFSDFVLDIITAHNKGVSITDSVARKSYEIKQSSLLLAKEQTAKLNTKILIPVILFKLGPLLMLLMIPIVYQIMNTFG